MSVGEVIAFAQIDADVQELIKKSAVVREKSYSPYSNFKVGATLQCTDGSIFSGCNVENSSYTATICAERAAIAKAVSEGKKSFKAITVVAEKRNEVITTPCGVCRQTIAEFGDIFIYCSDPEMKTVLRSTAKDLLPYAFKF